MPSLIQLNSTGFDVENWQLFLIGQNLLNGAADGQFGPATQAASVQFQTQHGLAADGKIGDGTYAVAMPMGLSAIIDERKGMDSAAWPPKPGFPPLVSNAAREALFGKFSYVADPQPGNPENIRVTDNWEKQNIIIVDIPQLKAIAGSSKVQFHRLGANQLIKLWADWESAGLLHFVRTWEGTYVPRFVRGSTKTLSNHSFGSAFDINAAWNGYGVQTALVGYKGSVREMVQIANANGFYWGGHFSKLDGMHFEVAKLMDQPAAAGTQA